MPFGVLHPALLGIGVACAAIPVLVHLLRRRYVPVSWGAMRFLEHALKKRRRRLTLEQFLLLTLRVLLVLAIAIGVASFVRPDAAATGPRTLVLVLDDSIHAQRLGDDGSAALKRAKARAAALLDTLDPQRGDRAALVTLGSPARAPAAPATGQLDLVRRAIEQTTATDAERDPDGAAAHIAAVLDDQSDTNAETFVLATETGWDTDALGPITALDTATTLIPIPTAAEQNTAVTRAISIRALLTPDADERHGVRVTLSREGGSATGETRVAILDGDTEIGSRTHTWGEGQRDASVVIPIETPTHDAQGGASALALRARIGPDANPGDNTVFVPVAARRTLRIGIIERATLDGGSLRPSRWVRAVLDASGGLIEHTVIDAGAASDRIDPSLDAVVVLDPSTLSNDVWEMLGTMRERGAVLIITPDADPGAPLAWVQRVRTLLGVTPDPSASIGIADDTSGLATDAPTHPLLSGIRDEYASLAGSIRTTRVVRLGDVDRNSVLASTGASAPLAVASADGRVVVFAVAFDERWTDLPARPLFVALLQEILRRGVGAATLPETLVAGADDRARTAGVTRAGATGITAITRIVNPDTRRTTSTRGPDASDPGSLTVLSDADAAASTGDAAARDADLLGVWPFVAALLIAAAEFVLARRCSLRLKPAGGAPL